MTATRSISHKDTKPAKGFYYNEPKNVLFFVFFVASCDQMRRIIQICKHIFLLSMTENLGIR